MFIQWSSSFSQIDSTGKRGNLLLNSYMTTSILFLSILVLLLLSVFLIFKVNILHWQKIFAATFDKLFKVKNGIANVKYLQLTSRVESMESVLEDIQEYIEKVTVNNTDKHLIIDRMDPGNVVLIKKSKCEHPGKTNCRQSKTTKTIPFSQFIRRT